jgi:hypothetical protein
MSQLKTSNKMSMKFGGVWADFHENIKAAEESKKIAEQQLLIVIGQRDALQVEKDDLLFKFRDNVASLTDSETNHLEAKQILEHIRQERQELISRCLSLDTQREWLEKQNKEFRSSNGQLNDALVLSEQRVKELESKLSEEQHEAKILGDIVFKRDEVVEGYQKQLRGKQEELDVLQKSLLTKDRQMMALVKERNRLRDEGAAQAKALKKFSNLSVNKSTYQFDIVAEHEDKPTKCTPTITPLKDSTATPITSTQSTSDATDDTVDINPYADLFSDILPSDGSSSSAALSRKALTGANDFDLRERRHTVALNRAEEALRASRQEVAHLKEVLATVTASMAQHQRRQQQQPLNPVETQCDHAEEVSAPCPVTVTRHAPASPAPPSPVTTYQHRLVTTPPHSMTRRVASAERVATLQYTPRRTEDGGWNSSPVTVACGHSAEKRGKTPVKDRQAVVQKVPLEQLATSRPQRTATPKRIQSVGR